MTLGQKAQDGGYRVLITVDEAHVLQDDGDYQALGACFQRLVRRSEYQLPLAPLIAGISALTRRIAQSQATFLQRLKSENVGLIDKDASRLALLYPITDLGAQIDKHAVDFLVTPGHGYPYYLQLLGGKLECRDGAELIGLAHAHQGAETARTVMEDLLSSRWDGLSPQERAYLSKMAQHETLQVETGELAETWGRTAPPTLRISAKHLSRSIT